jgi:pimeloyl-ACP methyl ester carboxylesterase
LLSPAQTFGGVDKIAKAFSALKLKMFPTPKRLNRFFEQFSYYPEKIDRKYKEQFYLANKFGRSKPDLMKMFRFSKTDLQTLKIPVLVLVGDHDVINDEDILVRATEMIPQVETAVIKDAGHFLSIDQAQTVNKKIIEFLDKK